jgi:septal ring factor EnvC (AmiA/AmiB activator)
MDSPLWRALVPMLLVAGLALSGTAHARKKQLPPTSPQIQRGAGETKAEIREKRSDLKDIKRRIGDLQRDLEKNEASYAEAARVVSEAEREVSKATRALRQVVAERAVLEQQLAALEVGQREGEARIVARQNELAGWLRRHYIYGAANDVAALLAAGDPNQFMRDAHYLELLGRVRLELIAGLRADLQLNAERAHEIAARQEALLRLEEKQRQRQGSLEETHVRRRNAMDEIASTIKTQRAQVGALKADEERLAQVVNALVQRAVEAEARAEVARRERERARAQQGTVAKGRPSPQEARPAVEPVVGNVRQSAGPTPTGTNFAQLRGRLHFPVMGELIGRFGAQRAGQGTSWRGVFIRAVRGSEVRAISDGAVVFSDWLRGYGNLLIVDHGGGYLSIYGNNDALYKEVGNVVHGGDAIASVGTSGVEAESGLYFEIRHRGEAVDPMQWVKLK